MIIPEDILKTQLCSECQQYLTVPPIKVYPNRHIKCGRCVQDNDNGVVSLLYETMIEQFEFPCVNRFEGCTEIMKFNDCVTKHEESCVSKKYECPLCKDFTGNAYYLQLHLTRHHSLDELHHSEVVIDLDAEEVGQKTCWYLHKVGLVIVFCKYNAHQPGKLWLDVAVLGERKPPVTQSFSLRSLKNNKITYKTEDIPCSIWGRIPGNGFTIDIDQQQFPKRTVICVFDLKGHVANACKVLNHQVESVAHMPKVMLNDTSVQCNILNVENPVANMADINRSTSRSDTLNEYRVTPTLLSARDYKKQLTFFGITGLKCNCNIKQLDDSPCRYFSGDAAYDFPYRQFEYHVRRGSECLEICLEYDGNDEFTQTREWSVTITLGSQNKYGCITGRGRRFESRYQPIIKSYTLCPPHIWKKNYPVVFTNFVEWNTLMNSLNKYVKNDSISFEVSFSSY